MTTPADFGSMTQQRFERLVRKTWKQASEEGWHTNPVSLSLNISQIVLILSRQPELLEGTRLNHNLGAKKMEWLRELVAQTQVTQQGGPHARDNR